MLAKQDPIAPDIEKHVILRTADFAGVASFLRGSKLLTIMPTLMKGSTLADFEHAPLPYPATPLTMYMLWHQRYQNDVTHQWLRQQLQDALADLEGAYIKLPLV